MNPNIQYFLDKLQEESAEIIQAVSKIRRFGPDNHHPERSATNKQELVCEIEDFLALLAALEYANFFDLTLSKGNIATKFQELIK